MGAAARGRRARGRAARPARDGRPGASASARRPSPSTPRAAPAMRWPRRSPSPGDPADRRAAAADEDETIVVGRGSSSARPRRGSSAASVATPWAGCGRSTPACSGRAWPFGRRWSRWSRARSIPAVLLPNLQDAVIAQNRQIREEAQRQAERIDDVAKDLDARASTPTTRGRGWPRSSASSPSGCGRVPTTSTEPRPARPIEDRCGRSWTRRTSNGPRRWPRSPALSRAATANPRGEPGATQR